LSDVGWLYLFVIPAIMTLLLVSLAFVVQDVMVNEKRGLGWEGSPWWLWARSARSAAIVLGVVELLPSGDIYWRRPDAHLHRRRQLPPRPGERLLPA
jgi:hypothetical protein